ncbi:MAG: nucleoside recognition domain-containing protein [Limnochordia bacterium]
MTINKELILEGANKGLITTWELAKVLIPTTIIISLLQASGYLDALARFTGPFMGYMGLPGEAAVVLFTGFFLGMYAAVGAMVVLPLTLTEMTILAVMLSLCHSLIVELAINKKAGTAISLILPIRLGTCLLAGFILGGIL